MQRPLSLQIKKLLNKHQLMKPVLSQIVRMKINPKKLWLQRAPMIQHLSIKLRKQVKLQKQEMWQRTSLMSKKQRTLQRQISKLLTLHHQPVKVVLIQVAITTTLTKRNCHRRPSMTRHLLINPEKTTKVRKQEM